MSLEHQQRQKIRVQGRWLRRPTPTGIGFVDSYDSLAQALRLPSRGAASASRSMEAR